MGGTTINNSTNVIFSAAFQVAFALNVRAALLDYCNCSLQTATLAVVWVFFQFSRGEKAIFLTVHTCYACAEML